MKLSNYKHMDDLYLPIAGVGFFLTILIFRYLVRSGSDLNKEHDDYLTSEGINPKGPNSIIYHNPPNDDSVVITPPPKKQNK